MLSDVHVELKNCGLIRSLSRKGGFDWYAWRTDSSGHLPFQIDCGEEPDTSAVGLSDVVIQHMAVRVLQSQ